MNAEFTAIIQTLVAEQGKDILANPGKCKAFLPDYTKSMINMINMMFSQK